jgi:uncharacterized OsmC-like protein
MTTSYSKEENKMAETQKKESVMLNGIKVDELFATIDVVKNAPVNGKFKFRATNKWVNGGHNRTSVANFYGTQKDHDHKVPFELDADEPPLLLGEDRGPNPVEYLLTALAGCVTSAIVYHAAAKGIKLNSVESRLEGDIDLRGFLGLSDDVHRGYEQIRMYFKIDADAPAEKLEEIVKLGPTYSPVYDTITRAVPVIVKLEK